MTDSDPQPITTPPGVHHALYDLLREIVIRIPWHREQEVVDALTTIEAHRATTCPPAPAPTLTAVS